jgi:hypothetical protein
MAGWGLIGVVVVGVALGVIWVLWRRFKPARVTAKNQTCECGPPSGCNTGTTCDVPPGHPNSALRSSVDLTPISA